MYIYIYIYMYIYIYIYSTPWRTTLGHIIIYNIIGSIFGKRYLLAVDHIMLALFWSYVPNMK